MLAQVLATLTEATLKAQLVAVKKLTALLESADDPRELRRIATTLLRLKVPVAEAVPASAPERITHHDSAPLHHATPAPLLPNEIADLPRMKTPDHFTRPCTSAVVRERIANHAAALDALYKAEASRRPAMSPMPATS